jgi:hypothetical protein
MEKHTYDPDKDGIIALAQLVVEVCNNTDTDTKVAAEAAARVVDVDAEETARIADVNAEETARINALNTHTELPAAHHTKTIDASELTAGILALARLAGITNTQIAVGAAIAYTKLALAGLIRNTDIKSDAAIAESKLALAQGTQALFNKIAADILTHKNLANAHHAQSHTLASHSSKAHTELTGVSANQHHTPAKAFFSEANDLSDVTETSVDDADVPYNETDYHTFLNIASGGCRFLGGLLLTANQYLDWITIQVDGGAEQTFTLLEWTHGASDYYFVLLPPIQADVSLLIRIYNNSGAWAHYSGKSWHRAL